MYNDVCQKPIMSSHFTTPSFLIQISWILGPPYKLLSVKCDPCGQEELAVFIVSP